MAEPVAPTIPGIGDNKPPEAEALRDQLKAKYDPLLKARTDELLAELNAFPDPLPDNLLEEALETLKAAQTQWSKIDGMREVEKEPWLAGGRTVDGYFKGMSDALKNARLKAKSIYDIAHDLRATALRRQAEEEARRRREAADKARREAEEAAQRQKEEAERARREAADAERKRQEEADRLKKEATLEAEKAQREATIAAKRAQEEAAAQAEAARAADRERARAENRSDVAAAQQQRVETAKPSEFARIRTDHGVVSTQIEEWTFTIDDYDKIPRALIWRYIAREAISEAVKAAVKAGVREIKGVRIFRARQSRIQ